MNPRKNRMRKKKLARRRKNRAYWRIKMARIRIRKAGIEYIRSQMGELPVARYLLGKTEHQLPKEVQDHLNKPPDNLFSDSRHLYPIFDLGGKKL